MEFSCNEGIRTIWIIGLSSAGKTTLAELLTKKLWENGYPNILLDGTQLRGIFETKLGYDIESRRKQTRRMLSLAQWVSSQGIIPVVALIHPVEEDRTKCRESIKGYYEVYLKCNLDTCIKRDTKDVYAPALRGETGNVLGLDITYDNPEHSDLVIESEKYTPENILEILWNKVEADLSAESQLKLGILDKDVLAYKKELAQHQNQSRGDVCVE